MKNQATAQNFFASFKDLQTNGQFDLEDKQEIVLSFLNQESQKYTTRSMNKIGSSIINQIETTEIPNLINLEIKPKGNLDFYILPQRGVVKEGSLAKLTLKAEAKGH